MGCPPVADPLTCIADWHPLNRCGSFWSEQPAMDEFEPDLSAGPPRRVQRGRTLFEPLFAATGRLLVFLPVFASGILAILVSRRAEVDPWVALRSTSLATGLHGGLVILHFLRTNHFWRWIGVAELFVALVCAILVALRFVTGGTINL
jgi:hypothetical protein